MKNDARAHILPVHHLLAHAVAHFPHHIFLEYKEETITFRQFASAVLQCAQKMNIAGVQAGDRVLIVCDNSPLFYVGYCAAWQCGAVAVPANSFLKMNELRHVVFDCTPTFLVTDAHRVAAFVTELAEYQFRGISTEYTVSHEDTPYTSYQGAIDDTQMAVLVYTSGTTGTPKGVMLSCRNIMTNVTQCIALLHLSSTERILCVLPLFHVFTQITCVWLALFWGATVIIVPKIERMCIIEGLKKYPTIVLGVPALYGLFCMLRTLDFSSVRLFVSGGDALPDKIRCLFALLYGRKIVNGYGLSETSPVIAVELDDVMTATNTVGRVLPGIAYQIRLADGTLCAPGQTGQLFVKGDTVMLGYYNDPEATAAVITEGWFDTGDCAYMDDQEKLVITGREKDLIISKGFNVYPQEVENVISLHLGVLRVAVVGKDDELNGQVAVAFVQLRTAATGMEGELAKLCANHLANYKIPRAFFCSVTELPMTATGKVDKKILRAQVNKK